MLEHRPLRRLLYAFGNDLERQAVGQRDDGAGDRLVGRRALDVADEGLVDLEPVDRKASQVAEAGNSRTEIVDGKSNREIGAILDISALP